MSVSIRPGDTISLRCPEGATSVDQVGQFFPEGSKEKFFSIIAIEKNEVTIGPLKVGDYEVSTRCSDGSTQTETVSLKALSKQEMPEPQPMVDPFFLAFPLWFWLLLFAFFTLIAGGIFFTTRQLRNRRAGKPISFAAPKPTGQELLEAYLKKARAEKWVSKSDQQSLNEMYSKGYDSLRSFLEHKLHFKASWATSSEFMGSFKASLIGYSNLPTLTYDVELVLNQSDLVRFSKDIPTEAARENYLNSLQKIYDSVIKITRSEEGETDTVERSE